MLVIIPDERIFYSDKKDGQIHTSKMKKVKKMVSFNINGSFLFIPIN